MEGQEFAWNCLINDVDEFIDWKTGKVDFDTEYFRRLMELSRQIDQQYQAFHNLSEEERRKIGRAGGIHMFGNDMTSIFFPQWCNDIYEKQEGASFLGFPRQDQDDGITITFPAGPILGITASCSHPEAAWDFLKMFCTVEEQLNSGCIPLLKEAYQQAKERAAATKVYTDTYGNVIEPNQEYEHEWSTGMSVKGGPMTKDELLDMDNLITRINRVNFSTNTNDLFYINQIIGESLAAYYAGDKNVDQTIDEINSRVGLYVSEHT